MSLSCYIALPVHTSNDSEALITFLHSCLVNGFTKVQACEGTRESHTADSACACRLSHEFDKVKLLAKDNYCLNGTYVCLESARCPSILTYLQMQ
jgi:hypothetical protein